MKLVNNEDIKQTRGKVRGKEELEPTLRVEGMETGLYLLHRVYGAETQKAISMGLLSVAVNSRQTDSGMI
jgi:hypothetical protein